MSLLKRPQPNYIMSHGTNQAKELDAPDQLADKDK